MNRAFPVFVILGAALFTAQGLLGARFSLWEILIWPWMAAGAIVLAYLGTRA